MDNLITFRFSFIALFSSLYEPTIHHLFTLAVADFSCRFYYRVNLWFARKGPRRAGEFADTESTKALRWRLFMDDLYCSIAAHAGRAACCFRMLAACGHHVLEHWKLHRCKGNYYRSQVNLRPKVEEISNVSACWPGALEWKWKWFIGETRKRDWGVKAKERKCGLRAGVSFSLQFEFGICRPEETTCFRLTPTRQSGEEDSITSIINSARSLTLLCSWIIEFL